MKRVILFKNGTEVNGKVVLVTHSLEELLTSAGAKFSVVAKRLFTKQGGEIDDLKLIRMFAEGENGFIMTPSNVDKNGAYLIDRSPTYFEPVLNYLRNGQLIFDSNVNPEGVLEEARFFGIESLVPQLETLIQSNQRPCDNVPLTRRDVVKALILTPYTAELRFQGVNLAGSDLSRLDLRYINFKFACLHGCRMVGTNLSWCSLERADLSHAQLEGAQLLGVKMLCANAEGANLRGCNFEDPAGSRANMEGVNLKGADLEGSNMAGVNLRVATLKNANLQNCDLRAAVLAGSDLENCDLSGSDLHEANLRGANLKDAAFELMLTPLHMSQTIR
ncbi:BTB/POZ domain-containing protein KCTD9 isoform X2 [Anabrus simplex]|uniref:BTB/POZ domain-containing protein KCTD9 isoform X2 n=1 Tax=Anabrus simplex TaxID=316456 RepID=UPI0034DD9210